MSSNLEKIEVSNKITILALSWRDIKAPKAGGAEVHTHEMLSRADKDKYRIYHFSPQSGSLPQKEEIDGVTYIRSGNVLTVIWNAMCFYKRNRRNIDFVIDQCNTHRFFTPFWVKRNKRIFYIHQLTKEIWDYSAKFPLNVIGKATEEWMLKLNRKDAVITVSESTKQELIDRGYEADKIKIIHNGVSFEPWKPEQWYEKEQEPTFIYAGRYSPYKGIDVSIKAFSELKKTSPKAKLWIIGKKDQGYVDQYISPICKEYGLQWIDVTKNEAGNEIEPKQGDIISWGYVSEEKKLELLSRAWALLFPSIREGWGIPITEAGCVGTPSIAFDSPGIREAVKFGNAGYLCLENNATNLLFQMKSVIFDRELYFEKRQNAYDYSSSFLWEKSGNDFCKFIDSLH
ncbi:MAG: glycosyltransferase family 4 protein [Lachnospiraceae bacterium]|jgi:glycosyltransferase involved in cell wall biosynthesis